MFALPAQTAERTDPILTNQPRLFRRIQKLNLTAHFTLEEMTVSDTAARPASTTLRMLLCWLTYGLWPR